MLSVQSQVLAQPASTFLENLLLDGNCITDVGGTVLLQALPVPNQRLRVLRLSQNQLTDAIVPVIIACLTSENTKVNINYNALTEYGMQRLSTWLESLGSRRQVGIFLVHSLLLPFLFLFLFCPFAHAFSTRHAQWGIVQFGLLSLSSFRYFL